MTSRRRKSKLSRSQKRRSRKQPVTGGGTPEAFGIDRPVYGYLHNHEYTNEIPHDNPVQPNYGDFVFDFANTYANQSSFFYTNRKIIRNYLNTNLNVLLLPQGQQMFKGMSNVFCNLVQHHGSTVDTHEPSYPLNPFARRLGWMADFGTAGMYAVSSQKSPVVFCYTAIRPLTFFNINDADNLAVLLRSLRALPGATTDPDIQSTILSVRMATGYEATWEEQLAYYRAKSEERRASEVWDPIDPKHYLHPIATLLEEGVTEWRIGSQIYGTSYRALNRMSLYEDDMRLIKAITRIFPGIDGYYSNPVYSLFHGAFHAEICTASFSGSFTHSRDDPYDVCTIGVDKLKQLLSSVSYKRTNPNLQQQITSVRQKGGAETVVPSYSALPLFSESVKATTDVVRDISHELLAHFRLDDILSGASSQAYNDRILQEPVWSCFS